MPVYSTSQQYSDFFDRCCEVRTAISGEWAIKGAGDKYLPRLPKMGEEEYKRFLRGAKWYPATSQTIAMLCGMVARKPPVSSVPVQMEYMIGDATARWDSLDSVSLRLVNEVIKVGRVGVLVDLLSEPARPYLSVYLAEDIISFSSEMSAGGAQANRVVLREVVTKQREDDEFCSTSDFIYRVLDIFDGRYRQRVFSRDGMSGSYVQSSDDIFPSWRGNYLDRLPFVVINKSDLTCDVSEPPMSGLVSLNLHHYLLSGDYHYGLHYTAIPQPVVSGFDSDSQRAHIPSTIGPSVIWALPTGAQAWMLEFSGKGLGELRAAMDADKAEMADAGARVLESQDASNVAARTIELKQGATSSTLAQIVTTTSLGITTALRIAAAWIGANPDDASVALNLDFIPTDMDPAMLRELVAALQAGAISRQEFFEQMQAGELVRSSKTFDDHEQEISEDKAAAGTGVAQVDAFAQALADQVSSAGGTAGGSGSSGGA